MRAWVVFLQMQRDERCWEPRSGIEVAWMRMPAARTAWASILDSAYNLYRDSSWHEPTDEQVWGDPWI